MVRWNTYNHAFVQKITRVFHFNILKYKSKRINGNKKPSENGGFMFMDFVLHLDLLIFQIEEFEKQI